jgi:glucose/arabinose dehydrogenase
VNVFAEGFKVPRWLAAAPNGDIFVAETGANQIVVLRDPQNTDGAQQREVFATGTSRVFGIAFKDDYVYVGNINQLVRFRYDPKTSKRLGDAEPLLKLPNGGAHITRSVAISADGKHVFVSVGSGSNINTGEDPIRAAVTICDLDGKNARLFATGLRNAVGLAIEPVTGAVWVSVNERDELGDNLPPDYFTSLKDGGFYGWPYSYIEAAEAGACGKGDYSRCAARRARGSTAICVLYREPVSAQLLGRGIYRGAWFVEPSDAGGIPSCVCGVQGWAAFGRPRGVLDRVCALSKWTRCIGQAGGSGGCAGRSVARFG